MVTITLVSEVIPDSDGGGFVQRCHQYHAQVPSRMYSLTLPVLDDAPAQDVVLVEFSDGPGQTAQGRAEEFLALFDADPATNDEDILMIEGM